MKKAGPPDKMEKAWIASYKVQDVTINQSTTIGYLLVNWNKLGLVNQ